MTDPPSAPTPPRPPEQDAHLPWRWLRHLSQFLLVWPLLSLLALDEFESQELEAILIVILVPPLLGLILLGIEGGLTKTLGARFKKKGIPVPNVFRDLSNVAYLFFTLTVLIVVLNLVDGTTTLHWPIVASMAGSAFGLAIVLRALGGAYVGGNRSEGIGGGWDNRPIVLRFMGYIALLPLLIVVAAMIDYSVLGTPYIHAGEWSLLLMGLWIGLRSAMSRISGGWAKSPWEIEVRRASLIAPWFLVCLVGALVTGVFFIASPFLEDHETAIAVVLWLLIVPTGVFSLVASWFFTRKLIRTTLPRLRLANRLRRGEAKLRSWRQETSPDGALIFTLEPARGSGRWPSPDPRLIAYLEQSHPRSAPE